MENITCYHFTPERVALFIARNVTQTSYSIIDLCPVFGKRSNVPIPFIRKQEQHRDDIGLGEACQVVLDYYVITISRESA